MDKSVFNWHKVQVNIKSGYINISISWYIVGFPDKNVCLHPQFQIRQVLQEFTT